MAVIISADSFAEEISPSEFGHIIARLACDFGEDKEGLASFIEEATMEAFENHLMPDQAVAPWVNRIFEPMGAAARREIT